MQDLLQQLQEATINSNRSLTDALRYAKVLSARLRHPTLAAWAECELDGYPKDAKVPQYRNMQLTLKGHFLGPAGSSLKNGHIPHANLVAALGREGADLWRTFQVRQGIAECEHLASTEHDLRVQVPPDLIRRIGSHVYTGMNCVDAFAPLSASTFRGLLDTVRNRLLSFVLELEGSHGVQIRDEHWQSVPIHSVTQILNNCVLRDIAVGTNITQSRE